GMRSRDGHEGQVEERKAAGAAFLWRSLAGCYCCKLRTSNAVSCGGVGKPPSIPACIRGIRMPSRNVSQLSFDSWMATTVQPPSDGPAAWKVCPSGRLSLD